jgi:hypothetical protein
VAKCHRSSGSDPPVLAVDPSHLSGVAAGAEVVVKVPRLPLPLARRIDRLARRAHTFHRFAHHPLCEPYRGEVLRIGRRMRLCKGCTLLAAGLLTGALAGALARPSLRVAAIAWLAAVVLGGLSLRLRLAKVVGRFVPGAALALACWAGLVPLLVSLSIFAVAIAVYRRRGVERSPCRSCPERRLSPCSGFAPHVRRERAFRRRVARWLDTFPTQPRV